MKPVKETVRSLEQQESGVIRRFLCSACGRKFFESYQLDRHQAFCVRAKRPLEDSKTL